MAASRKDMDRWISTARERGDEYIISVCDTFDWDDYPVYCEDKEAVRRKRVDVDGVNMQTINEVIRVPKKKPAIENLSINEF
jgi:hypothetical protein